MRSLPFRAFLGRAVQQKRLLVLFFVLFALAFLLGIILAAAKVDYAQHLLRCERYFERVLYSARSVFLIFLERTASGAIVIAVLTACSVHPAAVALPTVLFVYRGYVCGGSVVVFVSAFGLGGVLVGLLLYLPVQLALTALYMLTASLSFSRSLTFCGRELGALFMQFLCALVLVAAICLAELLLLLVIFRPLGGL